MGAVVNLESDLACVWLDRLRDKVFLKLQPQHETNEVFARQRRYSRRSTTFCKKPYPILRANRPMVRGEFCTAGNSGTAQFTMQLIDKLALWPLARTPKTMPLPVKSATVKVPVGIPFPVMVTGLVAGHVMPLPGMSVTTAPVTLSGPLLVTTSV